MNEDEMKKAKELKRKFQKEFWPELDSGVKRRNRFGITGLGLGGNYFDSKTRDYLPVIRVYALSNIGKKKLTAVLLTRDDSREFLFWEGAVIEIVVTGRIVAC